MLNVFTHWRRANFTSVLTVKQKTLKILSVDKTVERTLFHCCWEYEVVLPWWKSVWQFLSWLNELLIYATTVLGIHPREKADVHTKMCTGISMTVLFVPIFFFPVSGLCMLSAGSIIEPYRHGGQKWKQCRFIDEWINKMCFIYSMEYYPTIKRS